MPRLARVVLPDTPYHITHRGNRGGDVFFCDDDRIAYLADLKTCAAEAGLEIWGYCLMSNHLHLIAVPRRGDALARGLRRAQQRHTRRINRAQGWTGHLWGGRYFSTPLDEAHLWTAIKYIELNPVRAGLVERAQDWPWSSAPANADRRRRDALLAESSPFGGTHPHPLTGRPIGWGQWLALGLASETEVAAVARLRRATSTGRPCGSESFIKRIERKLSRTLALQKPGPKPQSPELSRQLKLFGDKEDQED